MVNVQTVLVLLSRPSDADKGKVQAEKRDTDMEILVLGTFSPIDASCILLKTQCRDFWTRVCSAKISTTLLTQQCPTRKWWSLKPEWKGAKSFQFYIATRGSPAPAQCPNWQSHPGDAEAGETRWNVLSLAEPTALQCSAWVRVIFADQSVDIWDTTAGTTTTTAAELLVILRHCNDSAVSLLAIFSWGCILQFSSGQFQILYFYQPLLNKIGEKLQNVP